MKNNDLFRYERKFLLNKFSINSLEELVNYTSSNLYEKYHQRNVNSIYYDYNNFILANENIDGIFNRFKVRIRYYGNSNIINLPKLEIKSKYGNVGKKDFFNLNCEEIYKNNFSLSFLNDLNYINSLKYNFLQLLYPILKVSYKRNYFISQCQRFRYTLDTNINFKIFDQNNIVTSLDSDNLIYLNKNILELKYPTSLENEAYNIAKKLPARLTSISKYVMALNYLGLINT